MVHLQTGCSDLASSAMVRAQDLTKKCDGKDFEREQPIRPYWFDWAIAQCRARGCSLVQLTTDRDRPEAHRFYEQLGFTASHLGYKKAL